jgi:threonine dehydrogenase-like Zn-dependent dehydrogenase
MGEKFLTGSWGETTEDFEKSIEIIVNGLARVEELITHRLPLERTKEGLELFEKSPEDCIKIMLEIG